LLRANREEKRGGILQIPCEFARISSIAATPFGTLLKHRVTRPRVSNVQTLPRRLEDQPLFHIISVNIQTVYFDGNVDLRFAAPLTVPMASMRATVGSYCRSARVWWAISNFWIATQKAPSFSPPSAPFRISRIPAFRICPVAGNPITYGWSLNPDGSGTACYLIGVGATNAATFADSTLTPASTASSIAAATKYANAVTNNTSPPTISLSSIGSSSFELGQLIFRPISYLAGTPFRQSVAPSLV